MTSQPFNANFLRRPPGPGGRLTSLPAAPQPVQGPTSQTDLSPYKEGLSDLLAYLGSMSREALPWFGGAVLPDLQGPPEEPASSDMRAEENYSSRAAYQRAMDEVEYDTTMEYYNRFPFSGSAAPSAREGSNILRMQRTNALKLIASRRPETLEQFPALREALANSDDITEDDARRIINLAELDAAFEAIASTNDPIAQNNIVASMPPIQRAAFFEYIPAKLDELATEAQQDPSFFSAAWNVFYSRVVDPAFNALMEANEFGQQVLRSSIYSMQQGGPSSLLFISPALGATVSSFQYWDDVAEGSYDQEALAGLRAEYGADVVNALLRHDELIRDGQADPHGRWVYEMNEIGMGNLAREMTDRSVENERYLELERKINAAHLGNTGMLFLNPLPDEWKGSTAYAAAAGTTNVVSTFVADPTLIGAKAVSVFRGARYGLIKITGAKGVDDAFRYRRGRVFFNDLGRKFDKVRKMDDPARRAVAFDVITRQVRNSLPDDVVDDMFRAGVANAEDAHRYFVSKQVTEEILSGRTGPVHMYTTFTDDAGRSSLSYTGKMDVPIPETILRPSTTPTLGERLLAETQLAKRQPLLPGKTMLGVVRGRMRLWLATHNLLNNKFADDFMERFADEGLLNASVVGQKLVDDAEAYGIAQGVSPRLSGKARSLRADIDEALRAEQITPDEADYLWEMAVSSGIRESRLSDLLKRSSIFGVRQSDFGFRWTDKSLSARLDRLKRRFAKAPFGLVVKLTDGSDARKIYDYARTVVSRQDAAIISQLWREAPDAATRRLIHNGLVQTGAAARGVQFQGKTLASFLPEAKKGGVYSPTLLTQQADDGTFVPVQLDKVDAQMTLPIPGMENSIPQVSGTVGPPSVARTVSARPSNFNGREHALHLWQTSDYAALPDFTVLQDAGVRVSLFDAAFGVTHSAIAQNLVDFWSLGTLAGPRYYMRNAIEDFLFYSMTAGNWGRLYKGRRFSTAQRNASGVQMNRGILPPFVKQKNIPYPQKQLGIVNKVLYGTNKVDMDGDNPVLTSVGSIIRNGFTDEDKIAAINAMKAGDVSEMRSLIAQSMVRQKLPGYTDIERDYLLDFVTEHGEKILAEVTEATRYGVSGSMPDIGRGAGLLDDAIVNPANLGLTANDGVFNSIITAPGQWGDVSLSGSNPLRFVYWHSGIIGAAERDGVIGKLAIGMLDRSDEEIASVVARAIDADTVFRYKDRMAAFYESGVTTEEFARRYVRDVRNLFSNADGTLNRELWEKIAVLDDDGNRVVSAYRTVDEGRELAVSVKDLSEIPSDFRPTNVLGRESVKIANATSIKAFDKVWAWMGDQYARVAREPIFFANYLEARRLLAPMEEKMISMFGEKAARRRLSKIATDRAYGLTLSYTDNPANRTMLAWNVRNVARFYRAAEDFVRRMMRVGKNYPQGFWKIALTYDVLDDTGFVYTDENDEKYFVFPGSAQAIDITRTVLGWMGTDLLNLDTSSFEMRGYVRMIAPSTDPQQWIPTLSSPLSAFPMKVLFDIFPSLKSFEQAVLGEYSEGAAVWESLLPSHALRLMSLLDKDERNSAYASAMKDAIQVAAAAGVMPGPLAPKNEQDQFFNELNSLVYTMLTMRVIGGFTMFTSPRITSNDVSDFARQSGVLNMDSLWRTMINTAAENGSENPYADAMVKWVETFGTKKLPYTISTYESGDVFGGLSGLTAVQATKEGEAWVKDNQDLIYGRDGKFKTAAAFLMPRSGEFSFDMLRWLEGAGLKLPRSYVDMMNEVKFIEGKYVYYAEMELADEKIAEAEQRHFDAATAGNEQAANVAWGQLQDLKDRKLAAADLIRRDYPELNVRSFEISQGERQQLVDVEIRPMLDYIFDERGKDIPEAAYNMADALATFDKYRSRIDQIEGATTAEDEQKRLLKMELEMLLNDIGGRDDNTKFFVDRILIPMIDSPLYLLRPENAPENRAQTAVDQGSTAQSESGAQ